MSSLLENGFLVSCGEDNFSFSHTPIAGYLAAQITDMVPDEDIDRLFEQPDWEFKGQTLHYMATEREIGTWARKLIQKDDMLARGLLKTGKWLSILPKGAKDRQNILKVITQAMNDSTKSIKLSVWPW